MLIHEPCLSLFLAGLGASPLGGLSESERNVKTQGYERGPLNGENLPANEWPQSQELRASWRRKFVSEPAIKKIGPSARGIIELDRPLVLGAGVN
jgi:hypothetical protein